MSILLAIIIVIFLVLYFIKKKRAVNLIKSMFSDSFYSETENILKAFVCRETEGKKACLVFLDESLNSDYLDTKIVPNKQNYKKMDIHEFISNLTCYSKIEFILVYYETGFGLKRCSFRRDTFIEIAKSITN